ncbi:ABC transporter substrate-binding protein [Deinococcus cellulosilyticus]|uniref:ABC transporter substrate-binding protein n=1 Tax=Deinococcus cellulosilyticus (strain DSM 18568 / NBRC 106333 / KACC 11606 / 5516J-15) TaxID=1223518 RepID=A0A511MV33_DEIC1|nr:ABC transporter substrate-binding protein [Deinococcus cellulosilyticus]GEM44435.1 ABC transporter substrate-binding protein [Deinococcus cellulosilyticus NBRC 106333 = KACC 11606]
MKRQTLITLALATLASPALAKDTVTIWYPWGDADGQTILDAAAEYNKAQDNVTIKAVLVSGAGIQGTSQGKFLTAVASGQAPDAVLYWGQDVLPGLASIGALMPLNDILSKAGIKGSNFNSTAWKAMQFGGKTYGVPEMSNVMMLYYNKDLFKAAGLDPNKPPKTIEELDAYADKLTVKKGKDIDVMGFIPWIAQGNAALWTGAFGGSFLNSKTKKSDLTNAGTLKALQWQATYIKKYGADELNRFQGSLGNLAASSGSDPFIAGKIAMEVNGQWHAGFIKRYGAKLNYGVAPVPMPKGARYPNSFTVGNTWMIPKGSKNALEALKFIAWFSDARRSAAVADKVFNISPVKGAPELQKVADEPVMKLATELLSKGRTYTLPPLVDLLAVNNELTSAFQAVQLGKTDPRTALETAQKNVEKAAAQGR